MSTLIISEDFSELTVGDTAPPIGWANPFGQFLVVFMDPDQQSASPHAARFFSGFVYDFTFPVSTDFSVFFGFKIDLGNNSPGPLVQFQAQSSIDNSPVTILSIIIEADRSLSMQVGTKHVGNSADPNHKPSNFVPFYINNGVWCWLQVSLQANVNGDLLGSISYFDLDLVEEGWIQFGGTFDPSNFDTGGSDPISAGIRWLNFNSGIGFMFLRQISMWTPHFDPGDWPFPLASPNFVRGRVSQGTMEIAGPGDTINARVSQAVIEEMQEYKFNQARVSQGVIEVLTNKGNPPGGWKVREV